MAEIKTLTQDEFYEIAAEKGFDFDMLNKDYYLTVTLFLIKDIEGLFFKGGTAIQKTILDYSRLSEDIDFSVSKEIENVKKEILKRIRLVDFFHKITTDKDVDGFTRIVLHYKTFSGKDDTVFIDLNQRAKLVLEPQIIELQHFYEPKIPKFSLNLLNKQEIIAEKVAAAIGRNKPRDYYDVYKLIKADIPIDIELVKKKCISSDTEYNIIKMFKNAKKLKNKWDHDINPLLVTEVSFVDVITTLATHFNLKLEKEKIKNF